MAPARHRLVKPEFGPDAGVDVGVGVGAGAGNGYESPSEDNLPPFFASSSGATAAATTATTPAAPPALVAATRRPIFVQRPSYIVATGPPLPENGSRTPNGLNHGHSLSSSLNHVMASAEKASPNHRIGIRDRIACYQWTYFTMVSSQTRSDQIPVANCQLLQTMSTGGIANILHACKIALCHPILSSKLTEPRPVKWKYPWIHGIGVFFVLLNAVLFIGNCVLLSIRFRLRPGTFTRSFTDQFESLFIPAFVSLAPLHNC